MLHKRKENYLSMKMDPIFVNEAYVAFDKCIDIIQRKVKENILIFVEKFNYYDI